jgi:hypothetical protein
VLASVAEEQRLLWSARRRDTLNQARTNAIRQLRREGWAVDRWPTLLVWVLEDWSVPGSAPTGLVGFRCDLFI